MRKIYILFLLLFSSTLMADSGIAGFWETIDKDTNKPSSVIAIYFYQNKYYGRIIGTINEDGQVNDSIYHPVSRAPGVKGNPHYCGLDIVWGLELSDEGVYKGHVYDPREGKVYKAEVWRKGKDLVLRGEVLVFGRNVVWPPFPEKNFTGKFKMPDVTKFVPKQPDIKN